jgi:hypothetical protein
MEEVGRGAKNLPFQDCSVPIVLTVERFLPSRKHVARPEVAHEANTVQEVCTLAPLDQDCDKSL